VDCPLPKTSQDELLISEGTQAVRDLLTTLPMAQRLAIAWATDGFSVKEIAKELGALLPQSAKTLVALDLF
jgi:hypothetical protein